jgi:hypothetical protein
MKTLLHGHEIAPGISCNDKKFEIWELEALQPAKDGSLYANKRVKVQVYSVPANGFRGAPTAGFKVVINGVEVTDSDLQKLRQKATAMLRELTEEDHEKVLIVKTSGYGNRVNSDQFGLSWRIGWRVAKLGVIFNSNRDEVLHGLENYDEPEDSGDENENGVQIGSKPGFRGKKMHNDVVIPWTQEREDMLRRTVKAIGQMRDDLNDALLEPDAFTSLLDGKKGILMLKPPKDKP